MDTPTETMPMGPSDGPVHTDEFPSGYGRRQELGKGSEMGRYVVLRRLGAGGMGTVYLAYDPELDRRVALKLLHGETTDSKRRALLREAQALARLRHPNVVAVHDVGEHEGRVYVAMEFVEGHTLSRWVRQERRSWREILEVYLLAGRGLRAAHTHDLVHRDFKPDNVMVSPEGEVLVMDFGLARSSQVSVDEDLDVSTRRIPVLIQATQGGLSGTPAYMAPEHIAREVPSPASDQFAFCVSVWEALCGERPFDGDTLAVLFTNASEGRIRSPPARAMPRWLHRVLLRGLRARPEDRWASMAALLDVLEQGCRRWRRQAALVGFAVVVVVGGSILGRQQRLAREHRERVEACMVEGATIDEIWNDDEQQRLRSGLLATGVRFAEDSASAVIPRLDEYRNEWSSGRTEVCMHGSVWGDWDAELVDRSSWCFEDRRIQLESTVEQIATSSRAGARRAVRIASYLDPVVTCLEPNLLRRLPVPPMELRDEIRATRAMLRQSDQLQYSGHYGEALEVAHRAVARADAVDWPPLRALARHILGRRSLTAGLFEQAEAELSRAYFEAQDAGALEVAFRAARSLVPVLSGLQRHREAEVWARHAQVLAPALPDPTGLDEAEGHYLMIGVYLGLGDYESAIREGERAVSMRTEALGAEHPITAAAARNLGQALLAHGRLYEALEHFERALVIWEDAVGHEHPYIGMLARFRAEALLAMGRVDEALEIQEEGLAVDERVLREDHPSLAEDLDILGRILVERGELDEAERVLQRAMSIRLARNGPVHSTVADGLLSLALVDGARGLHEDALDRCARAVEILEAMLEPEHPRIARAIEKGADVLAARGWIDDAVQRRREALARRESARGPSARPLVSSLVRIGDLQRLGDEPDEARRSYERALSIAELVEGDADGVLVASLVGLAELAMSGGEPAEARRLAARAVDIVELGSVGPSTAAPARFVLARALAATEDPEGRVSALAEQARADFAIAYDDARRAMVEAWLEGEAVKGPRG